MPNWLRVLLIVLVGAGGVLLVGVLYQLGPQQEEPTWHPDARRWPRLPLRVSSSELHDSSVTAAMSMWNSVMGCLFFTRSDNDPDVVISGATGQPCGTTIAVLEPNQFAAAWLCSEGIAKIEVSQPGSIRDQYNIVAHELGHVIGLADDLGAPSVMAKKAALYGDQVAVVTDKDRAAIRARYCK